MTVRLGVLLSGRGSNFKSILDAIERGELDNAKVVQVLSNKASAGGLEIARKRGIPADAVPPRQYPDLESYDRALLEIFKAKQVDLLILAGYGKVLSPVLLDAFPGRILNIHPSLLPDFGGHGMVGMKVHQAVIQQCAQRSGCTVHIVTAEIDGGPILGQAEVPVLAGDTPEALAERVLREEHRLYPQVIRQFIQQAFANSVQE